jgi:L-iditol 2-dehydrogenase
VKALVLEQYNQFVYQDMPEPEIGADEVLIKVEACGICGSDVHGMDGSTGRRQPPVVMGHEASGIIAEVGANVAEYKPGERVTFDSTVYCGQCWYCRGGRINLCDNRMVLGVSCDDYCRHGALADYVSVPGHILYRLPEKVTFSQAAVVEACSIAVHAVERMPVSSNDTAVVVGAGMIGLLVVQALRVAGCKKIVVVDIDQNRIDLALKLGADVGLKADTANIKQEVLDLTAGKGADVAFEVVGINDTFKTAVEVLRKGANLALVGNLSPGVDFPLQAVVTREISLYGCCASAGEYPACLDMIAGGRIDVDALISAEAPLADGASWFKRLYDREPGLMKVILRP